MKKRNLLSVLKKVALFLLAGIFVVSLTSHFIWQYSGSGEWELLHTKDGVTVHRLKEPGDPYLKFKMQGQFHGSLQSIMMVMRDPKACDEVGCFDSEILKVDEYPRYQYYKFKYAYGTPFKDRQYVVRSEFRQDPVTKEIYTDFKSVPDFIPEDNCCVRVQHMHNIWEFKPLDNNVVEVRFTMNEQPGGLVPYFIFNEVNQNSIHRNVEWLQEIIDMDKYKNATVDYVQEYEPAAASE